MAPWYPSPDRYFAAGLDRERPLFQGDVLRGVPTLFAGHPAARELAFAAADPPTPEAAERPLDAAQVREVVAVARGCSMVLPHPCDLSGDEKGRTHSVCLVGRLERIRDTRLARKHVRRGAVHHAVWVPDWATLDPADDYLLDLRTVTAIDRAHLNPARRLAALSGPAWIALMRRIAFFFTRTVVDDRLLVLEQARNHPDYAAAGTAGAATGSGRAPDAPRAPE